MVIWRILRLCEVVKKLKLKITVIILNKRL